MGWKVARLIDLAIERCQDCDKKKLKSSIDSLAVKRCRALKNQHFFTCFLDRFVWLQY